MNVYFISSVTVSVFWMLRFHGDFNGDVFIIIIQEVSLKTWKVFLFTQTLPTKWICLHTFVGSKKINACASVFMRTKLTVRAHHFATTDRTSLVDLADIIQFYSIFRFNFEVFFVYYFYIVKRHSFTCFMTFLNEAHSRAILFLCKFWEPFRNLVSIEF